MTILPNLFAVLVGALGAAWCLRSRPRALCILALLAIASCMPMLQASLPPFRHRRPEHPPPHHFAWAHPREPHFVRRHDLTWIPFFLAPALLLFLLLRLRRQGPPAPGPGSEGEHDDLLSSRWLCPCGSLNGVYFHYCELCQTHRPTNDS